MEAKSHRIDTYTTICENVHPSVITSTTPGKRGGVHPQPCQITFKSLDGFLQACLCLRGPKAKHVSLFSAKCTAMVVHLHIALQKDLTKTKAELAEEKAQVQRRAFKVIKRSVAEWRAENGHPFTDCKWRLKNFIRCVNALLGSVYRIDGTPYVKKEYLVTAHRAVKRIYDLDQRNPINPDRSPPVDFQNLDEWLTKSKS